jgi:hypothetical protein
MKNINSSIPAPGTVVRLMYVAKDGRMTERLVFITSADAAHWHGMDLVKGEPRCFRRQGLLVAERVETAEQQQQILDRLSQGRPVAN